MENNNSVCYVARINDIKPIEGADVIEQVVVGGWNCISQKGKWKVDDLVVIATTDAVLPKVLSDQLEVTNYLRSGGRVRTIKLRGVYSECLIIGDTKSFPAEEGKDMQDVYGIYKYEPPIRQVQLSSGRKIKYTDNPNFPVYYKFPNLKNVPGMFTPFDIVQITRKIHGTNARYGFVLKRKLSIIDRIRLIFGNKWARYEFVVGSHNVEKGSDSQGFYDTNVWYEIEKKYSIKWRIKEFIEVLYPNIGSGFVVYGEIYGPGIQKGYDYDLKEIEFAVFDIQVDGEYKHTMTTLDFAETMALPHVPQLYIGPWSQEVQDKYVFNNFIRNKIPHEGIVIKDIKGDRKKVAKVINPDYLIYSEKHNVGDSH